MDRIRAAVIGCGSISVMHLDSIAALDEAMFEKEDLDAVYQLNKQ